MRARKQKRTKKTSGRTMPWRLISVSVGTAFVMFAIGYFLAVRVLFPPLPEPANGIVVPNLNGLTVAAAEAKLAQLGLRLSETIDIAHPSQPPGIIIAQSPLAGQQLRAAGQVQVGVSSGMPRQETPAPAPAAAPVDTVAPDTSVFDTIPADTLSTVPR